MPLFRIDNRVGYFAHIPKCGGSSVEHYLRAVCDSVVFIDNDFFSRTPDRLWHRGSPQHMDGATAERFFGDPGFFDLRFAVVRHPVSRFISAFYFQRDTLVQLPATLSLDDFVTELYRNGLDAQPPGWCDHHFLPMHRFLFAGTEFRVFRLEDGLSKVAEWFETTCLLAPSGIPITRQNQSELKSEEAVNRTISRKSHDRVRALYARDFEIFGY
ncbi:MAG: sulfotransferase family 2 domain-containing protein [Pseudomonadota bacterium]|nr:sulfotransferase family 2 domain-containing protein [Pseudomonadota bacterium]